MSSSFNQDKIVFIPSWVFAHLQKSGVTPKEMVDFATASRHLSVNDVAEWFSMETLKPLEPYMVAFSQYHSIFEDSAVRQQLELIAKAESLSKGLTDRLQSKDAARYRTKDEKFYDFVFVPGVFYAILYEGFLSSEESSTQARKDFVKDFVRALSQRVPASELSQTQLFRTYLQSL